MLENFLKNYLGATITLVGLLVTGVFWVHTIDGIPKRVDKLETEMTEIKTEVAEIKSSLSRNDVKTDIMLDDIKQMKMFILKEHTK